MNKQGLKEERHRVVNCTNIHAACLEEYILLAQCYYFWYNGYSVYKQISIHQGYNISVINSKANRSYTSQK